MSMSLLRQIVWRTRSAAQMFVDLSRNRLSGSVPTTLLQPGSQWYYVDLSRNLLVGKLPERSFNFSVVYLDLSDNQLEGPLPTTFGANSTIFGGLFLQNNHLSGDIQHLLDTCFAGAWSIRLAGNMFTGDIAGMLDVTCQYSTTMYLLDLSYNNLTMRSTPNNLNPLQRLLQNISFWELNLAGNNLTGLTLPQSLNVTYFLYLEALDLSDTNLEGELPPDLFTSTSLPSLSFLNLSNNRLSGHVPPGFTGMLNLTYLDVSYNNLLGHLPAPLPPNLWNASSFSHNPALCGGSLPTCPPDNASHIGLRLLLTVVVGSIFVSLGSCLLLGWRWNVYVRKHRQDVDLIQTLMNKETATLMPLRELQKATANFAESCQIGVGGFGTVYTGKLTDGTAVAVKRSKRAGSLQDKQQFLNEVRILSQLNHRHLVKLLGCCLENKIPVLVFEFISNGTLLEHLQGNKGQAALSWRQRLRIAVQTADALAYLHSAANPPIYHRDVKSANILLDEDLNAKVADFGISKLAPLGNTHISTAAIQGTLGYIDPEYYTSFQINDKSDVYSYGIVLLELISAQPVIDFRRGSEDASLRSMAIPRINNGDLQGLLDPVLTEACDCEAVKESILSMGKLAVRCLATSSRKRPSMKEVLRELQRLSLEADGNSDDVGCMQLEMSQGEDEIFQDSSYLLWNSSRITTLTRHSGSHDVEMADLHVSSMPQGVTRGLDSPPCLRLCETT